MDQNHELTSFQFKKGSKQIWHAFFNLSKNSLSVVKRFWNNLLDWISNMHDPNLGLLWSSIQMNMTPAQYEFVGRKKFDFYFPLQNKKKWHPKKWPFPISIQTTHQKYQYTLIHQKSRFWKITPTSHTVRFYLTHHNRTRFFHFSPKKNW